MTSTEKFLDLDEDDAITQERNYESIDAMNHHQVTMDIKQYTNTPCA